MIWFIGNVFPRLLDKYPDLELVITGDHARRTLPSQENVKLTGYVEDIRPYVTGSWISLAPIQQGGGTRLKIIEAMALRTPVVATPKGAEGLDVEHGNHLLLASSPEDFSTACCQILDSPDLRENLASNAYTLVKQKYDWQAVMPGFLNLVQNAVNHSSKRQEKVTGKHGK
jgi:polysaccharide biosynthesis protein PslH